MFGLFLSFVCLVCLFSSFFCFFVCFAFVSLCVLLLLGFLLLFVVLGFICLFSFHFFVLSFSSCHTMWLAGSWYPGQELSWASNVEILSPGCGIAREVRGSENINWCLLSQRYPSWTWNPATPSACKLWCWTPHAKQPAGGHSPTGQ